MAFTEITPEEININPFTSWSRYVLVTAGNIEKCNTLLVTWGGFGVMWRKKTATIYIRQSRFTKTILDSQDYFTLSFLPEKHKPQMSYMGSHSGRDENKYEGSGLHPLAIGDAAGIEEADLIFVCKKIYTAEMTPDHYTDKSAYDEWNTGRRAEPVSPAKSEALGSRTTCMPIIDSNPASIDLWMPSASHAQHSECAAC